MMCFGEMLADLPELCSQRCQRNIAFKGLECGKYTVKDV